MICHCDVDSRSGEKLTRDLNRPAERLLSSVWGSVMDLRLLLETCEVETFILMTMMGFIHYRSIAWARPHESVSNITPFLPGFLHGFWAK